MELEEREFLAEQQDAAAKGEEQRDDGVQFTDSLVGDRFLLFLALLFDSLALPLRALLTRLNFGVKVIGQCLLRLQILLSQGQLLCRRRQPANAAA